MELPSDKTKLQLEITNWPKGSYLQIFTILVALMGYGVTWYLDRETRLEQIHDQKVQFERQQLQNSIDRKMTVYDRVEKAISEIRRIWYITRAKCAFDPTYATDPKKIEAVNLERWNARINLMEQSYYLDLAFAHGNIPLEIWKFNEWERSIKNICAQDSISGTGYWKRQSNITHELMKALSAQKAQLKSLTER